MITSFSYVEFLERYLKSPKGIPPTKSRTKFYRELVTKFPPETCKEALFCFHHEMSAKNAVTLTSAIFCWAAKLRGIIQTDSSKDIYYQGQTVSNMRRDKLLVRVLTTDVDGCTLWLR
jgi:hypothetical protein